MPTKGDIACSGHESKSQCRLDPADASYMHLNDQPIVVAVAITAHESGSASMV